MFEEEYRATRQPNEALRTLQPLQVPFEYTNRMRMENLPDEREIYNHDVANSAVTIDEKPMTLTKIRVGFQHIRKVRMPLVVAESRSDPILGYAYVYP